jgi:ABC-type oligopeptide transport system substrate-binding subunit
MNKKLIVLAATGLLTFSCLSIVGCNSNGTNQKETLVFVNDTEHGKVETNQTDLVSGNTELITITPNSGYVVDTVTANNKDATKVNDTTYSYVVVNGYNFIDVQFKEGSAGDIDDPVDVPDGTLSNNTRIAASRGSQGTVDSYYASCKGLK